MQADSYIKSNNLTVSIVSVSQLEEATRIDSEYYKPEFLKPYRDDLTTKPIGDVLTNCQYGLSKDMNELGLGYEIYRMNDLKNGLCDDVELKRADVSENIMRKYRLSKNDILFNRVNSIEFVGRTGIFKFNRDQNRIFASYLIRLNTDETQVLPDYLNLFLNCKFGVKQIKRKARQAVNQANVNAEELKRIAIPIASTPLQQKVEELSERAFELRESSKKLYSEVSKMLLSQLGFADFTPSTVNYSSRSSKEATEANRFDSEYWLPKYDQLLEVINKQEHVPLASLFHKPIKGIEVGSSEYVNDDGIPFVRVSDFSVFGIDEDTDKRISVEAYEKLKDDYMPKVGELLFTKDGTVGITAVLDKEVECVLSGAFLRLKPKSDIDPHYLALLINSMVCKMQIERLSGGALIIHFKPDELAKIVVPIVDEQTQKKIGNEVRNAFQLRIQSKELLEVAKRAVEVFIEQDEAAALEYIRQNYDN